MADKQPAVLPKVLPPVAPPDMPNIPHSNDAPKKANILPVLESDDDDFERLRPTGSVKDQPADGPAQLTPQQLELLKQMRGIIREAQETEAKRVELQQAEEAKNLEQALASLNEDMHRPVPKSRTLKPKVETWLEGVHPNMPANDAVVVDKPVSQSGIKSPEDLTLEKREWIRLARMLEEVDLLRQSRLHYMDTPREVIEEVYDDHRGMIYEVAQGNGLDVPSLEALERSFQTRRSTSLTGPRRDPEDTDPSLENVAGSAAGTWFGLGKGSMYDEVMTDQDVEIGEANDGESLQPRANVPIGQYLTPVQVSIRKKLAETYGTGVVAKYSEIFRRLQVFPKTAKMEMITRPPTLDGLTTGPTMTASATPVNRSLQTPEASLATVERTMDAAPLIALDPANPILGFEGISDDAVVDFDGADDDGRSVTGSGFGPVAEDDARSELSGFSD
jgi:hypothetical protein